MNKDLKFLGIVCSGIAGAVLAGGALGYAIGTHGPSIKSPFPANKALLIQLAALKDFARDGAPGLRVHTKFTDFKAIQPLAVSVTNKKAGAHSCEVVINNDYLKANFVKKIQASTKWDDEQVSLFILGHEIQHCISHEDVHSAIASKTALTDRQAAAVHDFTWGTKAALQAVSSPGDEEIYLRVEEFSKKPLFSRADESISDIAGLLLVQRLSKRGLDAAAVDGLKQVRDEENSRSNGGHFTSPALSALAIKLHLDDTYGKHFEPAQIVNASYELTGQSKPAHLEAGHTTRDLQHAREQALSSTGQFSM